MDIERFILLSKRLQFNISIDYYEEVASEIKELEEEIISYQSYSSLPRFISPIDSWQLEYYSEFREDKVMEILEKNH
jgi:hypothetical protein